MTTTIFWALMLAVALSATASAPFDVSPSDGHGGGEVHRRGDESALEAMLTQQRSSVEEEATASRVAFRRRIHEEHIRAHLAVDPDVPTEATDEVLRRYMDSRRRLLESASKPTTGLRLVFLCGIAVLPIVGFIVWMKL